MLVPPVMMVLAAAMVEIGARVACYGEPPLLPYRFENGATLLPAYYDSVVAFPGRRGIRFVTDAAGARVSANAAPQPKPAETVLVFGDSQALGYMVEFEQTFGARVAEGLSVGAAAARLLAAPATHPDAFLPPIQHYLHLFPGRQKVAIATLNLGNDLDEAYAEVFEAERQDPSRIEAFLLQHSFAYMVFATLQTYAVRGEDDAIGLNRILLLLTSAERVVLAQAVAERTAEALAAVDAARKLVVIIPPDYQLDAGQFEKYAVYYDNRDAFDALKQDVPRYARMMRVLEAFIAKELTQRGIPVVSFSSLVAGSDLAPGLVDEHSHHLTASAHAMLAAAVLDVLKHD